MSDSDDTPKGGRQPSKSSLAVQHMNSQDIASSPKSTAIKAVSIAEPGSMSPLMRGKFKDVDSEGENLFNLERSLQNRRANMGRRISGRLSAENLPTPRAPIDLLKLYGAKADTSPSLPVELSGYESSSSVRNGTHPRQDTLFRNVSAWIKEEKARRAEARARQKENRKAHHGISNGSVHAAAEVSLEVNSADESSRRPSDATSEGSQALEKLQEILERSIALTEKPAQSTSRILLRRPSSIRKLKRQSTAASSDSEYFEGDAAVPSCEVVLDNSKTLSYTGGLTEGIEVELRNIRSPTFREKEAWKIFKYEIVRLAHTLRLKGWRRVPMEMSEEIEVERLSGALTNAVYEVCPPKDLPLRTSTDEDGRVISQYRPRPSKLLLRIYGSQVDHLIDRESELQILRRLARKRIGPRLLGTFANGRFEEFFNARTLRAPDLRVPDTSKQIAKRMRELHDGIELLESEREDGPFVFRNIEKWIGRCEKIAEWLDGLSSKGDERIAKLKLKGSVCGTGWTLFREAVERYRKWLEEAYGGLDRLKERLVFAHNDAQYGNILRLVPDGESPLLLPGNEHKQLVVIDFEYANANLPGLEFANHFSEWCYNYHDKAHPHACTVGAYPTPAEQRSFLYAYISHRPSFQTAPNTPSGNMHQRYLSSSSLQLSTASSSAPHTPAFQPGVGAGASNGGIGAGAGAGAGVGPSMSSSSTNLISNFMLDARNPGGAGGQTGSMRDYEREEEEREEAIRREVERLRWETRAWRGINSARWVMWGIVQAKVPGMPDMAGVDDGKGEEDVNSTHDEGIVLGRGGGGGQIEAGNDAKGCAQRVPNISLPIPPLGATDPLTPEAMAMADDLADRRPEQGDNEDEEFDYLAYALERALFFWGDVLGLGIMKREELPEELVKEARVLDY